MSGFEAAQQPLPPDEERGPLSARFCTDPSDQRALARVRAGSALLASLAALAMLLGELPIPAFLIAVLALMISVVWLRQAGRAARLAKRAQPEALTVYAGGFTLELGERTHWVPWSNVERVFVDEERVDIVVQQRGTGALRLEPRYPGVDIHELVRTLVEAHESARGHAGDEHHAPRP